ncbi:SLC13 family permease [Cobetia sp. L2A1]|uniref:SLC13 family permease n=1 Tax=Cobetia sp. L2A1 TaxID=2686360 RepID=UPI00131EBC76|nr:SLC13 family permease [Cobetia sp. L2A1]
MSSLIVILAIVVSIVLGYRFRLNIGLFAIAFSYLIGCFWLGMSPNEVIGLWPLKIFFIIFSVCLFYSFAIVNGTLEKLAEHLLYRCRNVPALLPFAIFFSSVIISALGAGYYTVLAFMAPITLVLCDKTRLSLIVGAMAVNYGALAGANFVSSQSGIIFQGLMTGAGISSGDAFHYSFGIFLATMIVPIIVLGGLVLFSLRGHQQDTRLADVAPPSAMNREQRLTLRLTLLLMVTVLAPPITAMILPDSSLVAYVNDRINIGLIASVFSVIALLMKLGDERKAIASLPWGTIIMICGVGMLISIAIKVGTIDLLSSWVSGNIPVYAVPIVFGVIAAIMSLFASTLGVVTPALFPVVPALALQLGIDPMILFVAIVVGAQSTAISPFSSGGSLILGSCPSEERRNELLPKLLFKAAPLGFAAALIFNFLFAFVY